MDWQVSLLPDLEEDFEGLFGADVAGRARIEDALRAEFEGFKGRRLKGFFEHGIASPNVDRLRGSEFVGSIRLQLPRDHRATVLCLSDLDQAFVTHVFHKSQDPKYRKALTVHNGRVQRLLDRFRAVDERRR